MQTWHEVRPESPDDSNPEDLADVAAYLIGRGVAADRTEAATLFVRLLQLPARYGGRRVTVTHAARGFYLSRRALGRCCHRGGFPPASRVLTLGRVLYTIQIARSQDLTLTRAAAAAGWSDAFALSDATLRLTGLRPSQAREHGLVYLAEAWLQRELGTGQVELREPRPPSCPACGQDVLIADQGGRHGRRAS